MPNTAVVNGNNPIAGYLSEWLSTTLTEEKHNVTVLFCDIVGFTKWCHEQFGREKNIFEMLSFWFMSLDDVLERFPRAYKLETIGDCIVVVCNIPHRCHHHADYMVDFAFSILDLVDRIRNIMRSSFKCDFRVRIGLNTGYVVAGTIRASKKRFQIFGNTINVASRMESTGVPNRIHISDATRNKLQRHNEPAYAFEQRETFVKGLGDVFTYLISKATKNDGIVAVVKDGTSTDGGVFSDNNKNNNSNTVGGDTTQARVVIHKSYSAESNKSNASTSSTQAIESWSPKLRRRKIKKNRLCPSRTQKEDSNAAASRSNSDDVENTDGVQNALVGRHVSRRYSIGAGRGGIAAIEAAADVLSKVFVVDGSVATCKLLSKAIWAHTHRNVEYTTALDLAWDILTGTSYVKVVIIGIRLGDCWKAFELIRNIRRQERSRFVGRRGRKVVIGLTSEKTTLETVKSQAEFSGIDFLWSKTRFKRPEEFASALESALEVGRSHFGYRRRRKRRFNDSGRGHQNCDAAVSSGHNDESRNGDISPPNTDDDGSSPMNGSGRQRRWTVHSNGNEFAGLLASSENTFLSDAIVDKNEKSSDRRVYMSQYALEPRLNRSSSNDNAARSDCSTSSAAARSLGRRSRKGGRRHSLAPTFGSITQSSSEESIPRSDSREGPLREGGASSGDSNRITALRTIESVGDASDLAFIAAHLAERR
eukprot:g4369.t1